MNARTVPCTGITKEKTQPLTLQSSCSGQGEKHWQYNMEANIREFIGGYGSHFLEWLFHCDSFTYMHINDGKFVCMYVVCSFTTSKTT